MVMRYRIENINVPESGGIANPGGSSDESRDLGNRRIVHVLAVTDSSAQGVSMKVLTEEGERPKTEDPSLQPRTQW